jgi:hypothetical protein
MACSDLLRELRRRLKMRHRLGFYEQSMIIHRILFTLLYQRLRTVLRFFVPLRFFVLLRERTPPNKLILGGGSDVFKIGRPEAFALA